MPSAMNRSGLSMGISTTSLIFSICSIRHVRLLLHRHHCDGGVDPGRERDLNLHLVLAIHTAPNANLDVRAADPVPETDHILGGVPHAYDVLGVLLACVDDCGAAGNQ